LERARLALSALVLGLAACREERGRATAFPIPGETGPRITVEVLNASGKPGLAKSGTRVLREAGIDVVTFGNAPAAIGTLDSTRIVIRRGSAGVAERIRRALGVGRVSLQPDSAKLLDASVLLGADFAPRLDFHP
jgi:LytR cell envelope-related transcriptional attenuator